MEVGTLRLPVKTPAGWGAGLRSGRGAGEGEEIGFCGTNEPECLIQPRKGSTDGVRMWTRLDRGASEKKDSE